MKKIISYKLISISIAFALLSMDNKHELFRVKKEYSDINFSLSKDVIKTLEKYIQLDKNTNVEIHKINGSETIMIELKSANELVKEGYAIDLKDIESNNQWRNSTRYNNFNITFITYIDKNGELKDITKF